MNPQYRFLTIDWPNIGVVKPEHFETERTYHEERLRWLISGLRIRGVLRLLPGDLTVDPVSKKLILKALMAVTGTGHIIHLDEPVEVDISSASGQSSIMVQVVAGNKTQVFISKVSDTASDSTTIEIARLENQELSKTFLPECVWTDSHHLFQSKHQELSKQVKGVVGHLKDQQTTPILKQVAVLLAPFQSPISELCSDYFRRWHFTLLSIDTLAHGLGIEGSPWRDVVADMSDALDHIDRSSKSSDEIWYRLGRFLKRLQESDLQPHQRKQNGCLTLFFPFLKR